MAAAQRQQSEEQRQGTLEVITAPPVIEPHAPEQLPLIRMLENLARLPGLDEIADVFSTALELEIESRSTVVAKVVLKLVRTKLRCQRLI